MLKKTKIIATVGPACDTYDKLLALVQEGVNVFRLNFSHGKHSKHAEVIDNIRKINKDFPFNIAIIADLQVPKLRVGDSRGDSLNLRAGDMLAVTHTPCEGTKETLYLTYVSLHKDVNVGEMILIDDGKIETKVVAINHS